MRKEIQYDLSFKDFTDEDGMLILDLEEYIKQHAERGITIETKIVDSLADTKLESGV